MNMIEKVARAICVAHSDNPDNFDQAWQEYTWTLYVEHAKAAIGALKEPTEGMMYDLIDSDHIIGYETLLELAEEGK